MKIRNGFVSNSSSSSFCIGKNFMTDDQIDKLEEIIDDLDEDYGETYINDTKLYFFGNIDHLDHNKIFAFLESENLSNFASWGD